MPHPNTDTPSTDTNNDTNNDNDYRYSADPDTEITAKPVIPRTDPENTGFKTYTLGGLGLGFVLGGTHHTQTIPPLIIAIVTILAALPIITEYICTRDTTHTAKTAMIMATTIAIGTIATITVIAPALY